MIRSLRNLIFLLRIFWVLSKNGVFEPLETANAAPAISNLAKIARHLRNDSITGRWGQRLAGALTQLGPTFIKLGQSLATRGDLIGEQASEDLTHLQDRLPPFDYAIARSILEHELGAPIETLFSEFNATPVAAASIAQVHRAITSDGRKVAVKILRPYIETAIARDLSLLSWIARILQRNLAKSHRFKPVDIINVFRDTLKIEIDLRLEAAASIELAENFIGDKSFAVAEVDWDRTTSRVFTNAWIDGFRIDDTKALAKANLEATMLLTRAAAVFFNQVFRDGFFHADMHPGNMLVSSEGVLMPVDFGIMGRLDLETRYYLADILASFLLGNWRKVAEVHFRMGMVPANKSIDLFTQAVRSVGEPMINKSMKEISIAKLFGQVLRIAENFDMVAQPQLLLLHKTMVMSEGVGRSLNSNINMWDLAKPLIEEWMRENRGPEARIALVTAKIIRSIEQMPSLILQGDKALGYIKDGGIKLHPDTMRLILQARTQLSYWPVLIAFAAGWAFGRYTVFFDLMY
ncbi:2-polyprenylphenol 6-hydroxylase [Candidatus Endolissoclinum faulkneri L2]|uniref:2-polyprenylphenol 6-hydroxylase n=1 Tax=Candidatus Endolissoclinum faulkneri L2 TaxID=1193729 RepID=K7YR18_9PROT|nr:2-polyprenylphenol 6-hydroxylase [Candidatus Endolissoclinum faulkneri]AFX98959.1 2-polyprenylphenol 6-hydroxylase [Candidatus Endolissoclinum faulkneri L2]